jgi:hypothetical protein
MVIMKSSIFWNITLCGLLKFKRNFGGTFRIHLQDQRIDQVSRAFCLLHADFLLGLFFYPEDEGDMFLRNVVDFQGITCRYIPKDRPLLNI